MQTDITLTGSAGEYMESAVVVAWTVMPGTAVRKGDIVAVVETAKAATEIEAPCEGVMAEQLASIGTEVGVGGVLGRIFSSPDSEASVAAVAALPGVAQGTPVSLAEPPAARSRHPGERIRSSPLARRIAAGYGLDLSQIEGTGPGRRIKSRDVDRALRAEQQEAPSRPPVSPKAPPGLPSECGGQSSGVVSATLDNDVSMAGDAARAAARLRAGQRSEESSVPTIVFIHGFGSSATGWNAILPRLSSSRCMVVELPGHGRQTRTAVGFDDLVQSVLLDLEEADITEAHLVGHSLGAAVAAGLAATHAIRVRSLTLLAPAGLGPEINGPFFDGFLRADAPASLQLWLDRLVVDPDRLPASLAATLLRERTRGDLAPAQTRLARALFPCGTQSFTIRAGLANTSCPIKVISGARDEIIPPAHARGLGGAVAVHMLEGVGHMPHVEAPDLVSRLIAENCRAGRPEWS